MPAGESHPTLFVTTRWTLVCDAARGGDTDAVEALGALFRTYWPPLYRYVRRLGRTEPDAEDLVQGFFAHLLQLDGLRLADRDRGRFRAFLLGSLKHYMANDWEREHRLKRGGFSTHLSIDWKDAETGLGLEPEDHRSPDKLYDRDWAMALLDKVLNDLSAEEKELDFTRWKPFLSVSSAHLPYADIAAEFGITEGAARVAVHRLRKRYRQRLRDEIGRTLADEKLVEEEMRSLFAALSA
ncbi:MAG: sigma-70 family RNA polymerase sigma factor [Chthoniobacter sp.]|nr:sigma-70 family RNA polymerase sigma factor [Chthoniobacter sp.]